MKKATLTLLLVLAAALGYSQLTKLNVKDSIIGHVGTGANLRMRLIRTVSDGDTTYALLYHNSDYRILTDWQSIPFKGAATIADFKAVLREAFTKKRGEESTIVLGDTPIRVISDRTLGTKWLSLICGSGSTVLYERDLTYLFGGH